MRRMITTLALAAAMLLAGATSALAFEPPADPHEVFNCPGETPDPIAGFPGHKGQNTAIFGDGGPERTVGAWNATEDVFSNSGGITPVTICG